jgi:hypothetical protein
MARFPTFLGALALFAASAATPAFAGGELQLKSSMPVLLVLDGETIGTVQPLEPMLIDIDAGVHNLQIRGMLGKTLYDRDLIFDDDTRTELVWQRKELRLGGVVQLDPDRDENAEPEAEDLAFAPADDAPPAADPADRSAPPPVDMEHPEPSVANDVPPATDSRVSRAPTPPAKESPRPPLTRPTAPTNANAAPIIAPPVTKDVQAPMTPRVASGGGSVVIEATPQLDLKVTNGTQALRITVENGELVVEDANGVRVVFPDDGTVF